jgi:mRNA-degrading endonuclease RelE of RelBE toxin-antitoxin system
MTWAFEFADAARRDLAALPKAIQKRVERVLTQMAADPFQGDVRHLQGEEWKGVFRRRIGDYRLLFTAEHTSQTVYIVRILLRSGQTYR